MDIDQDALNELRERVDHTTFSDSQRLHWSAARPTQAEDRAAVKKAELTIEASRVAVKCWSSETSLFQTNYLGHMEALLMVLFFDRVEHHYRHQHPQFSEEEIGMPSPIISQGASPNSPPTSYSEAGRKSDELRRAQLSLLASGAAGVGGHPLGPRARTVIHTETNDVVFAMKLSYLLSQSPQEIKRCAHPVYRMRGGRRILARGDDQGGSDRMATVEGSADAITALPCAGHFCTEISLPDSLQITHGDLSLANCHPMHHGHRVTDEIPVDVSQGDIMSCGLYGNVPWYAAQVENARFDPQTGHVVPNQVPQKITRQQLTLRIAFLQGVISGDQIEALQWLMKHKTKVDWVTLNDPMKHSPLHIAALRGSLKCLHWLLKHGAEVDAKNSIGRTPLHLAACEEQVDAALMLEAAGADASLVDSTGTTPDLMFHRLLGPAWREKKSK